MRRVTAPASPRDASGRRRLAWHSRGGGRVLAVAALATLSATACTSLGSALGFRRQPKHTSALVITNGLEQAVNVYALPRIGVGEIFIGNVLAGITDTLTVRGIAPGATVRLRATSVDGGAQYQMERIVLGVGAVRRFP